VPDRLMTLAKAIDDFIIDRTLQPGINLAHWYLGLPLFLVARVCTVLGAGVGVIWLHRFDRFPSVDFYQDMLCLGIMVVVTFIQIQVHEARAPRQENSLPAVRATGLFWRTAWLLDLAIFPCQWPLEAHGELSFNFVWTLLVVLPYWIICCRREPPPLRREVGVLRPVTISVR
jgi:hypothetical protein